MLTDSEVSGNHPEADEDSGGNFIKDEPLEIEEDDTHESETDANLLERISGTSETGNGEEEAGEGSSNGKKPGKRGPARKKHSKLQLELAYEAYQKGMSLSKAYKLYGVPRDTLQQWLHRKLGLQAVKTGNRSYFSRVEELPLVDRLLALADAGFVLSPKQISIFAVEYVKANRALFSKNPFPAGIPGSTWKHSLLRRHPALADRISENWAVCGYSVYSEKHMTNWFGCASRYLEKMGVEGVLRIRQRVFAVDDVEFVVSEKGSKVTCVFGANACGNLLPPLVLYPKDVKLPSQEERSKLSYTVTQKDVQGTSDNALYQWLSNVFEPWLNVENVPRPVILFIDGNRLQMGYRSSEFCKLHQIVFVSLLPRSALVDRPLNAKLFGPIEDLWHAEVNKVAEAKSIPVHLLLNSVLSQLEDAENIIREGFSQSQIFPWNPQNHQATVRSQPLDLQQSLGSPECNNGSVDKERDDSVKRDTEVATNDGPKPKKYTQVQLQLAYEACQNGMSIFRASKLYGVPRGTLCFRLQHKIDDLEVRSGPKGYLSKAEELPLVDRLLALADAGFVLSTKQISYFAVEYAKANSALISKNPFAAGIPGTTWKNNLFRRHPALAERTSQNWALCGYSVYSEEQVPNWFGCASRYLEKMGVEGVLQVRQQVFTVDDVEFFIPKKSSKVMCLLGANASGNLLRPLVLYPKDVKLPLKKERPKLSYTVAQKDVEETSDNALYQWLSDIFLPWLITENVSRPVILFADGHRVRMGYRSSEFCKQHQIVSVSLLPRSVFVKRPLNAKLFDPMKKRWCEEVNQAKPSSIHLLLNSALNQLEGAEDTIREGFYQSQIYPWNPQNHQAVRSQPSDLQQNFDSPECNGSDTDDAEEAANDGSNVVNPECNGTGYEGNVNSDTDDAEEAANSAQLLPNLDNPDYTGTEDEVRASPINNGTEDAEEADDPQPAKKPKTGKPKKYTEVQLQLAYEACQNGMSQYRAAKLYGVPRNTLCFRLQHKIDDLVVRAGPKGYLTKAEELPLVNRLHALADAGFTITSKRVTTFAAEYVKENQELISTKNPFPLGVPGKSWTAGLYKRHPALAERTLENWACYGHVALSDESVANWFGCVSRYLEKLGMQSTLQERQRVFTVDDVNFNIMRNRTNVTCLFGASAYGDLLPPLVLYPQGKTLPSENEQSKLNYSYAHEDTEETAGNSLYLWLSKVFQPWLIEENVPRPVILFVDGHRLHLGYRSSEFCKQHQIIFVSLLPRSGTPRLLQTELFHKIGQRLRTEVKKAPNPKALSVDHLLHSVLTELKESSSNTIREAFYQSDIFPWNPPYQSSPPQPVRSVPPKRRKIVPVPAREPIDPMLALFRRMLESRLTQRQLVDFQAQRHDGSWQGPVEETCLFQVWRNLQDEIDATEQATVPQEGDSSDVDAKQEEGGAHFKVEVVTVKEEDPDTNMLNFLKEEEPSADDEDL